MALLAVDLGLSSGLALYNPDGRLQWYRSQNFGSTARLRSAVYHIFNDSPQIAWLVLEGGGDLATVWQKEATRRGIQIRQTYAEEWRAHLLYEREQRSGAQAKFRADELARRVIEWSGARRPTSLRHDTAEAILIGLWGVLEIGWLGDLPAALRR